MTKENPILCRDCYDVCGVERVGGVCGYSRAIALNYDSSSLWLRDGMTDAQLEDIIAGVAVCAMCGAVPSRNAQDVAGYALRDWTRNREANRAMVAWELTYGETARNNAWANANAGATAGARRRTASGVRSCGNGGASWTRPSPSGTHCGTQDQAAGRMHEAAR